MSKVLIAGNSIVITSERTLNDIKTLERFNPKALQLFDKDTNELNFAVATAPIGSVSAYGIAFDSESRNGDGKASITLDIPEGVELVDNFVICEFGGALINLNKVEAQMSEALRDVEANIEAVKSYITIA